MAGTGFHPEGHVWKLRDDAVYRFICANCAEVAVVEHQETECIDDV